MNQENHHLTQWSKAQISVMENSIADGEPDASSEISVSEEKRPASLHEMTLLNAIRHTTLQHEVVDHEEMSSLIIDAQKGDILARNKIISHNMKLVFKIAGKFTQTRVPLEDLLHEGMFGIIEALERFDLDKGFRFSTYAHHWIYQSIVRHLQKHSRVVRIPPEIAFKQRDYFKAVAEAQSRGELVDRSVIAGDMGVTRDRLENVLSTISRPESMDNKVYTGSDEGLSYHERLPSENQDQESVATEQQQSEFIKRFCKERLRPKEYQAIVLRFGIDGIEPMTLESAAQVMGVTRERVRQIEIAALERLKKFKSELTLN
jgi:RNA polymerase sigma factor (sigma-70 family)